MTDQINTVNVYDEARKALAEITAINCKLGGPWRYRPKPMDDWGRITAHDGYSVANVSVSRFGNRDLQIHRDENTDPVENIGRHIAACDPATMQAIAALVSAQDARIDARDAQDAQIAALRDALREIAEYDYNFGVRVQHLRYVAATALANDTAAHRAKGGKADE